jgi:hypothetical protein
MIPFLLTVPAQVEPPPPGMDDFYMDLYGFFENPPEFPKAWRLFKGGQEFLIEAEFENGKPVSWKAVTPYSKWVTKSWLTKLMSTPIYSFKGRLNKPIKGRFQLNISNCTIAGPIGVGIYPEPSSASR